MRLQTVLEVIPGYHPIYQDASRDLLAMVDDRYAYGGAFGKWASFTHIGVPEPAAGACSAESARSSFVTRATVPALRPVTSTAIAG